MSDPETPGDRDEGLRRGRTFEPADDRMWELPVQEPEPASNREGLTNWIVIVGVVVLILVVGLLFVWIV